MLDLVSLTVLVAVFIVSIFIHCDVRQLMFPTRLQYCIFKTTSLVVSIGSFLMILILIKEYV